MGKTPLVRRLTPPSIALAAVALLAVAGCGSDSSGETSTTASTAAAIPAVTSPLGSTTAPATSVPAGKGNGKGASTTAPSTGGTPAACTVPDAFQDFKYTGVDCASAVGLATSWDQNGKDCNTVDNPNVDEGYHRTCTVGGFTCTAKRDVNSDNRFVTCTQGNQSIRFTWLPA
jgi:hypothetical protein